MEKGTYKITFKRALHCEKAQRIYCVQQTIAHNM